MFSLIAGFWRMLFAKVQYQVLILGLDDSGKTTLLEHLRHLYSGSPSPRDLKIPPTVGLNIGRVEVDRTRLIFWDLGGQQGLRVLWDKYFSDAHAIIYLIDSTDRARLHESISELEKLLIDPQLREVPILILCNKQDSEDAMKGHQMEQELREQSGSRITSERQLRVQEISALTGFGIEKSLEWLLNIIPRQRRTKQLEERLNGT